MSIELETANPVRSFKARGTELVTSLLAGNGSRSVVCASAGNLGQALAWSGRGRGLDVTVVASRFAPAAKLDRIRALDARLELVDAEPPFDAVLIALGGALATGVGHVLKTFAPRTEVICVQPLGAPAMTHSWRQRRVVTTDSTDTIADGVAGRRPIQAVEPSAALGIAAILEDRDRFAGRRVVTIVCGSNVDMDAYHRWIAS